jgi:endoglucanase
MRLSANPAPLCLLALSLVFDLGVSAQSLKEKDGAWRLAPSSQVFSVSKAGESTMTSVALPVKAVRGRKLAISVSVKGTGISARPQSWNGIKVLIKIESPGDTAWSQLSIPDGTFNWTSFSGSAAVPESATAVTLILGLEEVTGKAELRDLSIRLRPLVPAVAPPPADRPIFTGHGQGSLRGAMVRPLTLTDADLDTLVRIWGANLIRWQLVRPTGGGADPAGYDAWLDSVLPRLDQILPQAERMGCRVVVDLHSPPGGGDNPGGYVDSGAPFFKSAAAQEHFIEVWKKLAARYGGNRAIWGFDLLNEPVDAETAWDCRDWNILALDAARAIRAIDPDRTIIVEPAEWGSPFGFASFRPLPLEGVVYSFHMYQPFEYTYQGIQGLTAKYSYPGKIGSATWDRAALKLALAPAADFARKWRVQMYVGEFGVARWAEGADAYLGDLISIFEEYRWDWSFHAFREWEGWNYEYDDDPRSAAPASSDTPKVKVLKRAMSENRRGT